MVILRELESTTKSAGGFYLSDDTMKNCRSGFYRVEAVGAIAADHTLLKEGDYVFADGLSSHYHTHPVCVVPWTGIILVTNENKSEIRALPGWALLEKEEEPSTGFIAPDNNAIRKGKIVQIVYPDDLSEAELPPFDVGDTVMITRQCEVYEGFSEKPLVAMKFNDIIARFDNA